MERISKKASLLSLASMVVLMFGLPSIIGVQSQNKEMKQEGDAVLVRGDDFDPPVKLTLIKSRVGVIEPGKKFPADEAWFKGLTIRVRNDSEKPVTHISLRIRFLRPEGQENELDFVEPLNYGESPIPFPNGHVPFNPVKPIMPGESIELKLSDEDYDEIRVLLKNSKYPPSIKKLKVTVSMLGFNDGTIWMGGKRYELDRDSPGKLIPLKKKDLSFVSPAMLCLTIKS